MDEAFDGFIREAEKLVSRKEFKGPVNWDLLSYYNFLTSSMQI
jgi:hypothetical protein